MSQRIRVLICDDVAMLRELIRYEIEEGDDVTVVAEADNGLDSVRLAKEVAPDVVILDLAMPGIDGLEALEQMRQLPDAPEVIVHSGFDAATMRERVLSCGAALYLEKGGDLAELSRAVREVARNPRP